MIESLNSSQKPKWVVLQWYAYKLQFNDTLCQTKEGSILDLEILDNYAVHSLNIKIQQVNTAKPKAAQSLSMSWLTQCLNEIW